MITQQFTPFKRLRLQFYLWLFVNLAINSDMRQ